MPPGYLIKTLNHCVHSEKYNLATKAQKHKESQISTVDNHFFVNLRDLES